LIGSSISDERDPVLSNFERYQRIARFYDLLDLPFEYERYHQIRGLLFDGLSGRTLDYRAALGALIAWAAYGRVSIGTLKSTFQRLA
jgi:curved DNA-binding protein CbpA